MMRYKTKQKKLFITMFTVYLSSLFWIVYWSYDKKKRYEEKTK